MKRQLFTLLNAYMKAICPHNQSIVNIDIIHPLTTTENTAGQPPHFPPKSNDTRAGIVGKKQKDACSFRPCSPVVPGWGVD